MSDYYQFSLFTDFLVKPEPVAVNCFTNDAFAAEEPAPWMLKLVPDGKFSIKLGDHFMVLRKLKSAVSKIPAGLEFCHFRIEGIPYFGIFVGT